MGTTQIYAGLTAKKDNLNIAQCKYIGFIKTFSANNYITESAATATAFATGKKTNNSYLGVDVEGNPLPTILEIAEQNGLSTGLVTTGSITNPTTSAFIAHQKSRENHEAIAYDYLKTDIDVFIGGGRNYFEKRKDNLNLIDSLKARNYTIITDIGDLNAPVKGKLAGLLYEDAPPKISEGRGNMLTISSLTAIKLLSQNEKGFFLVIEGAQIDWAGHANDSDYLIQEMVDFDNTVGAVIDFAKQDGETLVVITGDHECGGYAIINGSIETGTVVGSFTTSGHTAVMVPVFAYGPSAEEFIGIYDNTVIFNKFMKLYGF